MHIKYAPVITKKVEAHQLQTRWLPVIAYFTQPWLFDMKA